MTALLLHAAAATTYEQFFGGGLVYGPCPKVPPMEIKLPKYMGDWFVQKMIVSASVKALKCIEESYSNLRAGTFKISRRGVQVEDGKSVAQDAWAIPSGSRRRNVIRAAFRISIEGSTLSADSTDFKVLWTDYDAASIVYDCFAFGNTSMSYQSLLVLTRVRLGYAMTHALANATRKMQKFKLNLNKLKTIEQFDCPAINDE